ncbi:MAG TPA: type II secretion system protein GspN [Enhygromyxa sp.]|nr:type II secretion system protein GspN [Enhygromyxa sp.]
MSDDDRSIIPSLEDFPVNSGGAGPGTSGTGLRPSTSMAAGLGPSSSPFAGLDLRGLGRKVGRVAAWATALIVVFVISAWVSLPTRSIAWRISHEARKAGFNITVDEIAIRPWGSAKLGNVVWSFKPSRPDSTPVPFVIEELDVSFSVIKYLLFDTIDVEFEGAMDEGTLAGAYYKSDDESKIAFNISELPLYGVPKLQDAVNAPVRGVFAIDVDMTAPGNEWAKASGRLEVHCYSCTIGDGETKLYVPGSKSTSMLSKGVTIPEIDLGTLDGVLEIADGKAVAEEFGTESNDIVFKISGDIEFKDPIANSRLNLLIKVFIDPSLRERSDNVDLLVLTASPKVKMDPPDEGWMGVVLEGNFKHRRFRGIKSKSRAEQLREKRDTSRAAAKKRAEDRARQRAEREQQKPVPQPEAETEPEGTEGEAEAEAEGENPEMQADPSALGSRIPAEAGVIREEERSDEGGEQGGEGGDEVGEQPSEEEQPEEEQPSEEQPEEEQPSEEQPSEEEAQQFPQ